MSTDLRRFLNESGLGAFWVTLLGPCLNVNIRGLAGSRVLDFRGFEAKTTGFVSRKSHFGTVLAVPYCRGYPLVDSVWYFMHILCSKCAHLLKNPYIKLSGSEIPQVPALDESI